jgi:hypothetical protein
MSLVHFWHEQTMKPRCHDEPRWAWVTTTIRDVTCVACLHLMIEERDALVVEFEAMLHALCPLQKHSGKEDELWTTLT